MPRQYKLFSLDFLKYIYLKKMSIALCSGMKQNLSSVLLVESWKIKLTVTKAKPVRNVNNLKGKK